MAILHKIIIVLSFAQLVFSFPRNKRNSDGPDLGSGEGSGDYMEENEDLLRVLNEGSGEGSGESNLEPRLDVELGSGSGEELVIKIVDEDFEEQQEEGSGGSFRFAELSDGSGEEATVLPIDIGDALVKLVDDMEDVTESGSGEFRFSELSSGPGDEEVDNTQAEVKLVDEEMEMILLRNKEEVVDEDSSLEANTETAEVKQLIEMDQETDSEEDVEMEKAIDHEDDHEDNDEEDDKEDDDEEDDGDDQDVRNSRTVEQKLDSLQKLKKMVVSAKESILKAKQNIVSGVVKTKQNILKAKIDFKKNLFKGSE